MIHILRNFLDIVIPPSPEVLLLRDVNKTKFINHYSLSNQNQITCISSYQEPIIKAAIKSSKFQHYRHAHYLLGELFNLWLKTEQPIYDMCVPLPLSKEHLKNRGHNQVESVLLAGKINYQKNILTRVNRPPQTSLPKNERLENIRGAFTCIKPELIANKNVLLVDDVMTTGATLTAAKEALLPWQPSNITCVAFAH